MNADIFIRLWAAWSLVFLLAGLIVAMLSLLWALIKPRNETR